MSKQANKTLIGVFVVVAIVMLVAAVLIFGSGKFFKEKSEYIAYFDGSVKGLRIGAPVVFRGVRIGEVQDIALHYYHQELEFKIPVMITLYPDKIIGMGLETSPQEEDKSWAKLLDDGLRASLEMQSIVTGQLLIALDFHKDAPLKLYGLEESQIAAKIEDLGHGTDDITVELYPAHPAYHVCICSMKSVEDAAQRDLERIEQEIYTRLQPFIFAAGNQTMAGVL